MFGALDAASGPVDTLADVGTEKAKAMLGRVLHPHPNHTRVLSISVLIR